MRSMAAPDKERCERRAQSVANGSWGGSYVVRGMHTSVAIGRAELMARLANRQD